MYRMILTAGHVTAEDGNIYEIQVASPRIYATQEAAEKDTVFFAFIRKGEDIVLAAYPDMELRKTKNAKSQDCMHPVPVGIPIEEWTFSKFCTLKDSSLKVRVIDKKLRFLEDTYIFVNTDSTFNDLFPSLREGEYVPVDADAIYIDGIL